MPELGIESKETWLVLLALIAQSRVEALSSYTLEVTLAQARRGNLFPGCDT